MLLRLALSLVAGRQILENILIAFELIKGYDRKYVSPRCMIKIDLQKDYDSIEWPFIEKMMVELGFPQMFVKWIMASMYSISYSISINGMPSQPFPTPKGLR